jgi:alpha-tubulin suppressor-like RCC1 family protein
VWGTTSGFGNQCGVGDGTTSARSSPVTVIGTGLSSGWKQVATGSRHNYGVRTDGTIYSWGVNWFGSLGNNSTSIFSTRSPISMVWLSGTWNKIADDAGDGIGFGIQTNGTLYGWGFQGNHGQLGDGTTSSRSSPVQPLGGLTNWNQISVGTTHVLALQSGVQRVWAWGKDTYGEMGQGTSPGPGGVFYLSPVSVVGLTGNQYTQVSAGSYSSAVIDDTGRLWMWGFNQRGQAGVGNFAQGISSPVTVAGGGTNWKQVSTKSETTVALKTDGSAWGWGINRGTFQSGTGSSVNSPISLTNFRGNTWTSIVSGGTVITGIRQY